MKIEFEKQFGKGVDPQYAKVERWVKKKFKNPYLQHLALGFIEWLKQKWIDVKFANTMREIDRQSEEIKKIWEEKDKPKTIITETPSEVKGLNDMEIKYDGGSQCQCYDITTLDFCINCDILHIEIRPLFSK